jgi:general secretion pathway protein D
LGLLFVKATLSDLDTIERAIQALNQVSAQVHVKSRFIEVSQNDSKALGFDWYLGNFINGSVIANGGTAPSLNVPVSTANPGGSFPGNPATTLSPSTLIPSAATDQLLTGGLRNSGPALATITGILTDPNFRVVLHALEQRSGFETLGEPEAVTMSGRQTQMRATTVKTVITSISFNGGAASGTAATTGTLGGTTVNPGAAAAVPFQTQVETGPVLDVVPYVLADGYTINLALIPSDTEFNGYDTPPTIPGITVQGGSGSQAIVTVPPILPIFTVRQVITTVNVWDNQTVILGGLMTSSVQSTKDKVPVLGDVPFIGRLFQSQGKTTSKKNLMVFVTATIVDPAGNRVHTDDELPFAQNAIPPQPVVEGQTFQPGPAGATAAPIAPPAR